MSANNAGIDVPESTQHEPAAAAVSPDERKRNFVMQQLVRALGGYIERPSQRASRGTLHMKVTYANGKGTETHEGISVDYDLEMDDEQALLAAAEVLKVIRFFREETGALLCRVELGFSSGEGEGDNRIRLDKQFFVHDERASAPYRPRAAQGPEDTRAQVGKVERKEDVAIVRLQGNLTSKDDCSRLRKLLIETIGSQSEPKIVIDVSEVQRFVHDGWIPALIWANKVVRKMGEQIVLFPQNQTMMEELQMSGLSQFLAAAANEEEALRMVRAHDDKPGHTMSGSVEEGDTIIVPTPTESPERRPACRFETANVGKTVVFRIIGTLNGHSSVENVDLWKRLLGATLASPTDPPRLLIDVGEARIRAPNDGPLLEIGRAMKVVKQRDGSSALCGADSELTKVLITSGLAHHWRIYQTQVEALADLNGPDYRRYSV